MFNFYRALQYSTYQTARSYFVENWQLIIQLEEYLMTCLKSLISENSEAIREDYNEASYLNPFWQNYPPDERGRQPKGDQFPWIEVGEHSIGCKLPHLLRESFSVRDPGLPTGPDQRFLLRSDKILEITNGFTDSCWLFIDIKSVGPRDDAPHAVMSHNQISGDGLWLDINEGVKNSVVMATGSRTAHPFYCGIPPIYVLSDGTIAPVVTMLLKPVYKMLCLELPTNNSLGQLGQPLSKITLATIPNGLLLKEGPAYLENWPSLFFPGKDDKDKNPLKVRCRVSFDILLRLHDWRVVTLNF